MIALDRPRLRPHLAAEPTDTARRAFAVHDLLRLSRSVLHVPALELRLLQHLNGDHTLADLQRIATQFVGGHTVPIERIAQLVHHLDECLFLDTPRFRAVADAPVRPPSCIGAYEGDAEALREQVRDLFARGSGLPGPERHDGSLRAVLAPHIDYARGGLTYTHAFKELAERSAARLFVVVGTSHYSRHRFTITRKHFQTPIGVVPTDEAFIGRVVEQYGEGLFDDEWMAHFPEHSIELEVVFLQYLFAGKRDLRIVPLLTGPYFDCVRGGLSPGSRDEVARMVRALRHAEEQAGEEVCYVISGDLAHIGPKFDDPAPVTAEQLRHCREQDQALMRAAERADAAAYFDVIAKEQDARRICGLPPTWLVMQTAAPSRGRLLDYAQFVHPRGYESVSFASVVFDR